MSLKLTAQQVAAFPGAGMAYTQSHSFSPDGRYVACLWAKDGTAQRDLWLYDRGQKKFYSAIAASNGIAPAHQPGYEETMAREITRDRWLGITRFTWAPDSRSILVLASNRLLRLDLETTKLAAYTHEGYIAFAAFSPDSQSVAFHADGDLWLLAPDFASPARRLTARTSDKVIHGLADKVSREEISNQRAFCFTRDGSALVYARYDIGNVPVVRVGSGLQDDAETIAYSRPGEPVSCFSLHRLDLATGVETLLKPADAAWPYLTSLSVDGHDGVLLQRLNRSQQTVELLRITPEGEKLVHREQGSPWINVLGSAVFVGDGGDYLWLHERTGTGSIDLCTAKGQVPIGTGAGHVERILGLSADRQMVWFTATGTDPRERHVFKAALGVNSITERVTTAGGVDSVSFAPDMASWIHVRDQIDRPPTVVLESVAGETEFVFPATEDARVSLLKGREPQLLTLKAADGVTRLHAALYKPQTQGKAPLAVVVYGGPHVQVIRHSWSLTADQRTQRLVDAGFYVLKVDNRGSSGRGIAFEQPVYGHLGEYEVDDQAAAVKQVLADNPDIDPARVFVSGWSYGGYMALMCLCRYPGLFKNGVSGAPVIDWAEYDAQYTERYMGNPQKNGKGYASSSVLPLVKNLACVPLLIHGMKDENVLWRNSGLFLEEAAKHNKTVICMPLPRERHSVSGSVARIYIEDQIFAFLVKQAGL